MPLVRRAVASRTCPHTCHDKVRGHAAVLIVSVLTDWSIPRIILTDGNARRALQTGGTAHSCSTVALLTLLTRALLTRGTVRVLKRDIVRILSVLSLGRTCAYYRQ